jgi:hypothetical protein
MADDCRGHDARLLPVGLCHCRRDEPSARCAAARAARHDRHPRAEPPVPHPAALQALACAAPKISRTRTDPILPRRRGRRALRRTARPASTARRHLEQVDTFVLAHIFGHRNDADGARDVRLTSDRHPYPHGFREAAADVTVHAFHEHWRSIRDFDPDVRLPMGQFTREPPRARRQDGKPNLPGKARAFTTCSRASSASGAIRRTTPSPRAPPPGHDPVDFPARRSSSASADDPSRLPARGA